MHTNANKHKIVSVRSFDYSSMPAKAKSNKPKHSNDKREQHWEWG